MLHSAWLGGGVLPTTDSDPGEFSLWLMTNTPNTLHLSRFYLFPRTIDSVTFGLIHTRKCFYVSVDMSLMFMVTSSDIWLSTPQPVCDFGLQWKRWVIAHLKGEIKQFEQIPSQLLSSQPFPHTTFSSSTSTSSRLFAIMLIRSAKLSLSMHSPRCFTTSQSGKVSLWNAP